MANTFTTTRTKSSPTVTLTPPGTFVTTLASSSASGFYADEQDLRDVFGNNIDLWSDINAAGSADHNRIQRAMQYADDEIDGYFAGSVYTTTPHLTLNDVAAINMVGKWAVVLAGADFLYNARGQRDEADAKPTNQYSAMIADVRREMGMCKAGVLQLNAVRANGMGSTGPTAVCSSSPPGRY